MASPKPDETQILIMKADREILRKIAKVEGRTLKGTFHKVLEDYRRYLVKKGDM